MKKINYTKVLLLTFLLLPLTSFALSCSETGGKICSTDKSDFYQQDIGAFRYLNQTHTYETSAYIEMGERDLDLFKGKVERVSYNTSSENEFGHNYTVSLFDFKTQKEAEKVFKKYVKENKGKKYKNSYGSVYELNLSGSGTSLAWLNKNVMVSITTSKEALYKEAFLEEAFDIYAKKISPQDSKKITKPKKVSKNVLSADIKINGSDNPSPVKYLEPIRVSWTSNKAEECRPSGYYIQRNDGAVWGQGYLYTLPKSGDMTFYASGYQNNQHVFVPEIELEVACYKNAGTTNYKEARDSVKISVY